MANILPLFAAAPRLVISVNDTLVLYAIGLNLNVSIDVIPVKILGQYEIASLEPSMYNPVTGTFRVIRVMHKDSMSAIKKAALNGQTALSGKVRTLVDVTDEKGVKTTVTNTTPTPLQNSVSNDGSSVLSQSSLHKHLDPSAVLLSQTFDMELKLKVPKATLAKDGSQIKVTPGAGDALESFLKIINCRIVGMDGEIAPGRLLEEPLSFQGLLAQNFGLGTHKEESDSIVKDGMI